MKAIDGNLSERTPLLANNNRSILRHDKFKDKTVLRWNHLTLSIPDPKDTSRKMKILDNVSGYANNGELLGIIAASGGGKTSLLSMLSGRITVFNPDAMSSGKIQYKEFVGNCIDKDTFMVLRNNIAYVLQKDILYQNDTVGDAIKFCSILRNRGKNRRDKIRIANQIIKDLNLENVRKTSIGSIGKRGISGGERKRVSIGSELVTSPDILILDEPTTGLDNVHAREIMLTLKSITQNKNRCIVCSIHQPSYDMFELLDRVIILSNGKTMYQGYAKTLIKYLNNIQCSVPKYVNITDFLLQELKYDKTNLFITEWEEYKINNYKNKEIIQLLKLTKIYDNHYTQEYLEAYYEYKVAPLRQQCYELFIRNLKFTYRNRYLFFYRLMTVVICGTLQGIIWPFYKNGSLNTYNEIQNRYGSIKYALFTMMTVSLCSNGLTLPTEKYIFQKERLSNLYYTIIWALIKSAVEIPICFIETFVFALMIKYLCNFNTSLTDMYFIMLCLSLNSSSIGLFIGILMPTVELSVILGVVKYSAIFAVSGFVVSTKHIGIWIGWYKYFNPAWYTNNMFCIKEFHNESITANEFLQANDIKAKYYYTYVYPLLLIFIAYRLIAYSILIYKTGY